MIDLASYKLTFDEEFNTRSISQNGENTTWADIRPEWRADANSDVGFGSSSFVDAASGYDPFAIGGGALTITAVPDRTLYGVPGAWESGLIHTQGEFSQTYGYFEMRADLSNSAGAWDAFWMLPNEQIPDPQGNGGHQELDIVEHYGVYNQGTYRWIHTTDDVANPNQDLQVFSDNPSQVTGYHTYGMLWKPDTIEFFFDGVSMGSRPTPSDLHSPMFIQANLATQNHDMPAGTTQLDPMKIDYIRAFSNDPNAVAVELDTVSAPDNQDPGLYGATAANDEPEAPPATPQPAYRATDLYDGWSQWNTKGLYSGATLTSNVVLDVDGTMTADAVNAGTGSNAGFYIGADTGTTVGMDVKAGSAEVIALSFGGNGTVFNIGGANAGTVEFSSAPAGTYSIEARPDGWYHIEVERSTSGFASLEVSSHYSADPNSVAFYVGDLFVI